MGPVQSRLLTIRAEFCPEKSTKRSTCRRMLSTQAATVSLGLRTRSLVSFGSPISPVDPPTRIKG